MATTLFTSHTSTWQFVVDDNIDDFLLTNRGNKPVEIFYSETFPDDADRGHIVNPNETVSRNGFRGDVYVRAIAKDVPVSVTTRTSVNTISQTGTGESSNIDPLPGNPFNIGFGAITSGTVTYTVQHTFDGVNWFDHESIVDATDNQDGNYAYPVAGIRLSVTAGAGTVTLTTIQA